MVDLQPPLGAKVVLPAGSVIHCPTECILQSVDGSCPLLLRGRELIPIDGGQLCVIGLGAEISMPQPSTNKRVKEAHRTAIFEISPGSILDFNVTYLLSAGVTASSQKIDDRIGVLTSPMMLETTTHVGRSLKVGEEGLILGPAGLQLPNHLPLPRMMMLAGKMELLGDTAVVGTLSLPTKSFEMLDGTGKTQMTTYDAATRILPKGAILPCTTILPAHTVLLQGTLVPGGTILPAGTRLVDCSLPAGTILRQGTRVGGSMGIPDNVVQYE